MAYETGTASGVNDLLDKLQTFLDAAGWTTNKDQAQGSGWWLSMQKGSDLFVNFVSDPATSGTTDPGPWIYVYGATGYSSGSAYNAQPGTSGQVKTNKMTAPFTKYYFFEGDDYIHIVIEVESGRFRHIHAGTIEKLGTVTGGFYAMGTSSYYSTTTPSSPDSTHNMYPWENKSVSLTSQHQLYANAGDGAKWFTSSRTGSTGAKLGAGVVAVANSQTLSQNGLDGELFTYTPNTTNGITPLLPINVLAERTSGLWTFLGQVKDVRRVNMLNHQPGDTITIGSDEWLVFPFTIRSSTTGDATTDKSGYYGLAYRKNTA